MPAAPRVDIGAGGQKGRVRRLLSETDVIAHKIALDKKPRRLAVLLTWNGTF